MDRRQRVDVVEGERVLVLVDLLARQLAAQDLGEDVAVVIGLGGVDRHGMTVAASARQAIARRGLNRLDRERRLATTERR